MTNPNQFEFLRAEWPDVHESASKAASANQIEFINLIVDHLTEHGVMNASLLYESPFTDVTPQGPDGLFTSPQLHELLAILDEVRASAMAA